MRPAFSFIPHWPGHPILYLQDEADNDMNDKAGQQNNLHNFNNRIRSHKIYCFPEDFFVIFSYRKDEEVYAQVDQQKNHQENTCESHNKLLG
jgi:hypothetical protein